MPIGGAFRKIVREIRAGGLGSLWRSARSRRLVRSIERRDPVDEYRRWLARHRPRFEAPPSAPRTSSESVALLLFGESAPPRGDLPGAEGVPGLEIVAVSPGDEGWRNVRAARIVAAGAGDRFAPHGIARLLSAFPDDEDAASRSVVYADEDVFAPDGGRVSPLLKPAWSPSLARSLSGTYPGAPVAIGESLWRRVAESASGWTDAVLSAADAADAVIHVPVPLLTRRPPPPGAPDPLLGPEDDRRAAAERAARRRGILPAADDDGRLSVSVVLPTRDRPDLLGPVLRGVLAESEHVDLDLVVVDHATRNEEALRMLAGLEADGRGRVLRDDGPFRYSRLVNRGVSLARGDVLLLLNNDVLPRQPGWIATLVRTLRWPGVAAVGPRLVYPDGRIQHAGIALGVGTVTGHLHRGADPGAASPTVGPRPVREVAAVTGACLGVRRELWDAVGGLDEDRLPVAFSDVDLCLRLRERGGTVLMRGDIELVHHETASREPWLDPAEIRVMTDRWGDALSADPYLPPGLTRLTEVPHLELDADFPLAPRVVQRSGSPSTRS